MGWYARGVQPADAVKINVPLTSDTVFRIVHNSRHPLRGHSSQVPGTTQALARLGGNPQGILAVPLILRDKLAAILYCDTSQEEVPGEDADVIEVLVLFAAKNIDLLSAVPRPAGATTTAGTTTDRAAALRSAGEGTGPAAARPSTGPQAVATPARTGTGPHAVAHAQAPAAPVEESASTVMFSAASLRGAAPSSARPATTPSMPRPNVPGAPAPAPRPTSPEDQKAHEDAKRFARLVVSEIKLYNETKVTEGRRSKDLYERLKEDIERGRQMYSDRVAAGVRDSTNYFFDELVRILAGGDASALGPM